MQTRNERRVNGTNVFVASTPSEEHIAYLRVGNDWDAIGDQWLTRPQIAELISFLLDAYLERPVDLPDTAAMMRDALERDRRDRVRVQTVWQDRHLPPFNVPPTYPGLRSEEV